MKKGQISIFIIIGIIILMATATWIFSRQEAHQFVPEDVRPEERSPIQRYVDNCVSEIGKEAVEELALRGGWLSMPNRMFNDPTASITFFPGSSEKIPLWQHEGEIRVPLIAYMEVDLANYLEENIDNCVNGLEPFEDKYFMEFGEPKAEVVIAEQDVTFHLNYPMTLESEAREETMSYDAFSGRTPAKLKKVWSFAKDLIESANENGIFERYTLEMMINDPTIPFNGMDISCAKKKWYEPDLKASLQENLEIFLPGIRFKNTNYPPFMEPIENYEEWSGINLVDFAAGQIPSGSPPPDMWEYGQMFFNVTEEDYSDMSVTAQYSRNWGMFFNARPSDGPFMRSAQQRMEHKFLSLLCFQVIHFTYDVQYPILISIYEPASFGGDGLMFRFGMPVIMVSNEPDRDATPFAQDVNVGAHEEFCQARSTKEYWFYAEDEFTSTDLDEVNITYKCFQYECLLGHTDVEGGEYRLVTTLPEACTNGLLIAEGEDYLRTEQPFLGEDMTTIKMLPTRDFNVEVIKLEIPEYWADEDLNPNEIAVFQFEHNESDYSTVLKYPFEESIDNRLRLVLGPADYEVYFMMMDNGQPNGGYIANFHTEYMEMRDADTIVLKMAFEEPTPSTPEATMEMITWLYTNSTYKELLKPEFK